MGCSLKNADGAGFEGRCNQRDAVDQRRTELGLTDLEHVYPVWVRMPSAKDETAVPKVDIASPGRRNWLYLKMVVFEVFQAVAHVGLAAGKLVLPQCTSPSRKMRLVPARC